MTICVYLAGPMAENAQLRRKDIAEWRRSIISDWSENAPPKLVNEIRFLCPEWYGCDHSGIDLRETVENDVYLISECDFVLAWLDDRTRIGTFVEIGYAKAAGKGIVLLLNGREHIQGPPDGFPDAPLSDDDPKDWVQAFYKYVTHTNHGCNCQLTGTKRTLDAAGFFWFPALLADEFHVIRPEHLVTQARLLLHDWVASVVVARGRKRAY